MLPRSQANADEVSLASVVQFLTGHRWVLICRPGIVDPCYKICPFTQLPSAVSVRAIAFCVPTFVIPSSPVNVFTVNVNTNLSLLIILLILQRKPEVKT